MPTMSDILDAVTVNTIKVMISDQSPRKEWFDQVRKLRAGTSDNQFSVLLDAITLIILGDQPEKISIRLSGEYLSCWNRIQGGLRIEDKVNNLTSKERDGFLALCLWDKQIDPPLYEYLGLDEAAISMLCNQFLVIKVREGNNVQWYQIPDYVQNYFVSKLSVEEKIHYHNFLSRYLAKTIFDLRQQVSGIKIPPFDLITHEDGLPLGELHYEILHTFLAGPFIPLATEQTENIGFAKMVAELAILWNYHLLESQQFSIALTVAFSLSNALTRWGRVEEAKSLILETAQKWYDQEPERIDEINETFARFFGESTSTTAQELLEENSENEQASDYSPTREYMDELFNQGFALGQLGRYEEALQMLTVASKYYEESEDVEALSLTLYHMSDFYFKKKDIVKAMEVNYLSDEYARASDRTLLRGRILLLRGKIMLMGGLHVQAHQQLLLSLEIFSHADDKANLVQTYYVLGSVEYSQGNLLDAEKHLQEALTSANFYPDPFDMARIKLTLGAIHEENEKYDLAYNEINDAYALFSAAAADSEQLKFCQEMKERLEMHLRTEASKK